MKTRWFTAFLVCRANKWNFFENIFFDLKPLYLGQILTDWALVFCKHPQFWEEKDSALKRGAKMEVPPKKNSKFLVKLPSSTSIAGTPHARAKISMFLKKIFYSYFDFLLLYNYWILIIWWLSCCSCRENTTTFITLGKMSKTSRGGGCIYF